MFISQNSVKFSDIRRNSDQFFLELDELDSPVTIFKRSKPIAVIMNPDYYNRLNKQPDANWKNAKNSMKFLFKPLVENDESFDAVECIRKERGE